ncbi:unnamed protein product [Spirodela intermedia]|uniref:DDE Tnp4 domain-containing protein n=1 Tax=Spirodela intermedia TaxID=51605 RepID=A0A7I8ILB1_SPIIN|nr:unnamed protein product [Spirodela intermedia]CAA6658536.1 unnamed protein product [Spirodela intermedia]
MAPLKKSKKGKRRGKDPVKCGKKGTSSLRSPAGRRNPDREVDWWNSFWAPIPTEEDEGFKYFFRVSKKTFEYICSLVRQDLISRPPSGLINIEGRLLSVEKQSQVSVGAAFNVGQSTVSQVTWRFIESMEERARHHLCWPGPTELTEVKSKLEAQSGLPQCCGAVGTTRVAMTLPAVESSDDWRDWESNYSMFLQGIVDHETRFLDVAIGWPGSMTPARLLRWSGFFKLCESGRRLNSRQTITSAEAELREYIVGDLSYPLLPWLMTPYEEGGVAAAVAFNVRHRTVRQLAPMAFARLKGAWRILHKVMWRPDKHKLPSIILVCCLLHNIMVDGGDKLQEGVPLEDHYGGYEEQSGRQEDVRGGLRGRLCRVI